MSLRSGSPPHEHRSHSAPIAQACCARRRPVTFTRTLVWCQDSVDVTWARETARGDPDGSAGNRLWKRWKQRSRAAARRGNGRRGGSVRRNRRRRGMAGHRRSGGLERVIGRRGSGGGRRRNRRHGGSGRSGSRQRRGGGRRRLRRNRRRRGGLQHVPPPPLDLSAVTWLHPDVSGWPAALNLSNVTVSSSQVCLDHDIPASWPSATVGTAEVNANPWVFIWYDNQWWGATWEWLRPGQTCKNKSSVAGDHIKQDPFDDPAIFPVRAPGLRAPATRSISWSAASRGAA